MNELMEFYSKIGISPSVYQYGEKAIKNLQTRFEEIDQVAEYNQAKVLTAMQKNRASCRTCYRAFYGSSMVTTFRTT